MERNETNRKSEIGRKATRGLGIAAMFGGFLAIDVSACAVMASTDHQNRNAIAARDSLFQAVAESTGSSYTDISGPNRNMAGRFIDQDHMMVGLGKPSDIPASLDFLEQASEHLEEDRLNQDVKQAIDIELSESRQDPPEGEEISEYSERVLNMAKDTFTNANNGLMIDNTDAKIFGTSAGVMALGAGVTALSFWRRNKKS